MSPKSFLVCLLLGLAHASPAPGAEAAVPKKKPAVQVSVDAVRRIASDETVPLLGRIVALREGPIATEVAGVVAKIHAEVGERVRAGAPLLSLDATPLRLKAEVARAEEASRAARLAEVRASARIARSELDRMEKLKNSAAFTPSRYEDKRQEVARAEAAADAAEADRRIAVANRKLVERDLTNATLAAPYDGVVIERKTDVGAYIAKGEATFVMVSDRDIEVEADVPADLLSHTAMSGRSLQIELAEGHDLLGSIRAILPRENPRTRTRLMRVSLPLDTAGHALAVNRTVRIAFPSGLRREILSVAKDAVIRRNGQTQVMLATPEGAATRPVTLGAAIGTRFAVVDGLAEGDLAVVRGNERLAPGTPLKYQVPR